MKTTIRILGALAMAWAVDASADWVHCAREGEICKFEGRREVSYGAGKKWFVKVYTGSVKCDGAHFGGDPIQGTHKTCRMRQAAAPQEPQVEVTSAWKKCAGEGGMCKFNGQKRVAFGTDGKYRQRVFSNGTKCSNEAFGGDPVPGRVKVCLLSP